MCRRRIIGIGALAALLAILVTASEGQNAAESPPASPHLEPSLDRRLAERDRLFEIAEGFEGEQRFEKAVELLLRVEAIERERGLDYDRAGTASYLASIYEKLGEVDEARYQLQTSRSILERLASQEDAVEARWRLVDVEWQQRGFELRQTLTPDDLKRLEEATALSSKIFELWRKGRYREALPAARKALIIESSIYGRENPTVAKRLHEIGLLYHRSGDDYAAQDAWVRALDLRRRTLGRSHPLYGESLANLGEVSMSMDRLEEAEDLLRKALAVLQESWPPNHPDPLRVTVSLGTLLQKRGDLLGAEKTLLEARKRIPESGEIYRTLLLALASVEQELGDLEGAVALMDKLEVVTRAEVGVDHLDYSDVLQGLAALLSEMGDYASAEDYFERAAQILSKAEAEPRKLVTLRSNWSLLRQHMGDPREALRLLNEGLKELEGTLPRNHQQRGRMLMNLANVLGSLGRTEEAETTLREALAIAEDRLAAGSRLQTAILNNLGTLYQKTNDLPQARAVLARAAEQTRPDSPLGARIRINLAVLDLAAGRFDAAAGRALESALGALAENTNPRHPDYCYALANLAVAQVKMAKPIEGAASFRRSLDCLRDSLELAATVQSERQQLAMLAKARQVLDSLLSASGQLYVPAEEIYASVLKWKGVVLARRLRFDEGEWDGELAALVQQLQSVSSRLAALAHSSGREEPEAWRDRVTDLSRRRESLQRNLARQSDAYRKQQGFRNVRPQQVLDVLPPDAALIDLVEYGEPLLPVSLSPSGPRRKVLLAFVLRPGKPIQRVDLGPSEAIEVLIRSWRAANGLEDERGVELLPSVAVQPALASGRELSRRLWKPLTDAVGDARLILVSPDGPTTLLPFGALPAEKGRGFLLEERLFVWTPAAQILVSSKRAKVKPLSDRATDRSPPRLLAIGAVDFDNRPDPDTAAVTSSSPSKPSEGTHRRPSRAPRGGRSFKGLPKSGPEAEAVERIFRNTHPTGAVVRLEGRAASESAFRRSVVGQRFVHLATHGFFAPPWLPTVSLRPEHGVDVTGWNPGLLSGIAFAGANAPETGTEDGILTAAELETLDLHATEMLVLSACETGLGINVAGEGLLGLLRAAQAAGTGSVVASLWNVLDVQTNTLMERFYENLWEKKMSRAEALRAAQLDVLRTDRDPAAWAGWILVGEWR